MAARKSARAPRNDAVDAIEQRFGDVEGWTEAVADAAEANDVAQRLHDLRERHGLTQEALAALAGTTQSVIARLEDANYKGHSLSMLSRIATAVGERVRVSFEPAHCGQCEPLHLTNERDASTSSQSRLPKTRTRGDFVKQGAPLRRPAGKRTTDGG